MQFTRILIFAIGVAGLGALTANASPTQLILSPSDVIGGSGSYGPNPFNSGPFNATNVLDNQTGAVSDTEPQNGGANDYWLNPDNGPANAYITIDLGAAYQISQIELFNTHNSQYSDRGTGNFTILASNSDADSGGGNFALAGTPAAIVSGATATLVGVSSDPIAGQTFNVTDTNTYRYISFNPTSVATGGNNCCGTNNYGLNEIRVFVVPEPATLSLLGIGAVGVLARRRGR